MSKTVDNGSLSDYDVATGAGVVDADTQRVTLASDDPAVVALQALDNAIAGSELQVDVVTMPTVAVTGTFWQATQPVSAASLPLPSGAATAAKQPALGTAGTPSADVISIQGVASGTVVPVSDGGGALTVDGTVTANLAAGTNNIGDVDVLSIAAGDNNIGNVDIVTVPAPLSTTGGGTEATALRVTLASDSTGVLSVDDNSGSLTVDGTVAATQSGTWTVDLGATDNAVLDAIAASLAGTLTVTGGGSGVEYTEGDTDASITGSAIMWEDTGDTLRAVSAAKPLPVGDGGGSLTVDAASLPLPTGASTAANQTTIIGHLDGVEGLLTTIDADTGGMATSLAALDDVVLAEDAAHVTGDKGIMALAVRQDSAASFGADGDYVPLSVDDSARLRVDVVGSVGVTSAPAPLSTTGGGTEATALRVTLASDSTGLVSVDDNGGSLTVDNAGTFAVQATLEAGTNAIGKLAANSGVDIGDVDVTSVTPGTSATSLGKAIDSAAGATDTGVAVLAIRDDALSTLTPAEGDYAPLRVDSTGAQWVAVASGTVTASGTITAELSATDNAVLDDIATKTGPVTPGTRVSLIDVDETEDEIKATAGTLYSLVVTNLATSTRFVRLYNATAASTTVGTTTPWRGPYAIPAGAGMVYVFERGLAFSTALCIAATTGVADSDTGAPGANEVVAEVVYT